jgi:hypothetical protein
MSEKVENYLAKKLMVSGIDCSLAKRITDRQIYEVDSEEEELESFLIRYI